MIAEFVSARFGCACVALLRERDGLRVTGASGVELAAGVRLPSGQEPEGWIARLVQQRSDWLRCELKHGRRLVGFLLARADEPPPGLDVVARLAAPFFAAARPRASMIASLDVYIAQIAHDLRQPMQSLRISIDELDRRPHADAQQPWLDRCHRGLRAMGDLLDDLMALASPAKPRHQPLRLARLLGDVLDGQSLHAQARGTNLRLRVLADPDVHGLRSSLMRAFSNLVDNAVEASPRGGTIDVLLGVDGLCTFVEIRDEGAGVPVELRERVFEPFFTTRSNGTGLGLLVTRLAAQSHGGNVRFLDEDRGAVRFEIPHRPLNRLPA